MTCDGERGQGGAWGSNVPVRYANDIGFVGSTQVDNTNSEQASGLVSGSSISRDSNAPEPQSPIGIPKKQKTSHSRNLLGSGADYCMLRHSSSGMVQITIQNIQRCLSGDEQPIVTIQCGENP